MVRNDRSGPRRARLLVAVPGVPGGPIPPTVRAVPRLRTTLAVAKALLDPLSVAARQLLNHDLLSLGALCHLARSLSSTLLRREVSSADVEEGSATQCPPTSTGQRPTRFP